ncbi:MAG: phosphopyruvate hydratase [Planctomycetota bacterium]
MTQFFQVSDLKGREILDSRGRPTVEATCTLASGEIGRASVPSGASTGRREAVELRDGDPKRYRGLGCRRAAAKVGGLLLERCRNASYNSQAQFDNDLLHSDGTPDKSQAGANAILAASLAFARAAASQLGVPLYRYFAEYARPKFRDRDKTPRLPRLTINLFSGGKHAGGQVPIQDVLIVPASASTIEEALAMSYEVYQSAAELIRDRYSQRALTADEGGLAPPFPSVESMFDDAVASIRRAGFEPGNDVALAIDVAASHFYAGDQLYDFGDEQLRSEALVQRLSDWVANHPIVSVEDGLAEDDWQHWPALRKRLENRALTLGDDLLCTNPGLVERAIRDRAADALLLKVNQVGTVTEAAESLRLARDAGWRVTVSARSGETEDNWLADLAVGWRGDQIKIGSITQSERLAKYNRLLEIEAETRTGVCLWPLA